MSLHYFGVENIVELEMILHKNEIWYRIWCWVGDTYYTKFSIEINLSVEIIPNLMF